MKILAEKRPSQRARLSIFNYVFVAENSLEREAMIEHVLAYEPDNKHKCLNERRFHFERSKLFIKEEDDAMIMVLKFEKDDQLNPNKKHIL